MDPLTGICIVIMAVFGIALGVMVAYIGLRIMSEGGYMNWFNGVNVFEGGLKIAGFAVAAIFQVISESNR